MKIDALLIMQITVILFCIFSVITFIKSYNHYELNKIKNNNIFVIIALRYFENLTTSEYSAFQKYHIWRYFQKFKVRWCSKI